MQDLIVNEIYTAHNPTTGWYADVVYKYKVSDNESLMAHGVFFLEGVPGTHLEKDTLQELGNLIEFKLKTAIILENK